MRAGLEKFQAGLTELGAVRRRATSWVLWGPLDL